MEGSVLAHLIGCGRQPPSLRPVGTTAPYSGPVLVGPGLKANSKLAGCHRCSLGLEPWTSPSGMTRSPPSVATCRPEVMHGRSHHHHHHQTDQRTPSLVGGSRTHSFIPQIHTEPLLRARDSGRSRKRWVHWTIREPQTGDIL